MDDPEKYEIIFHTLSYPLKFFFRKYNRIFGLCVAQFNGTN
jgi:hypothetical protein